MWASFGKLQTEGHTPDIDRPLSFRAMARDTKGLLAYLGIDSVDVLGYSDGASIALELAVNHPGLVRSLVLASGAFDFSGYPPEISEGLKHLRPDYLPDSLYEEYEKVAPNPGNWGQLVEKAAAQARSGEGLTLDAIGALSLPSLVIAGDDDIILPGHTLKLASLLETSPIILKGDHSSYIEDEPQAFLDELEAFYGTFPA